MQEVRRGEGEHSTSQNQEVLNFIAFYYHVRGVQQKPASFVDDGNSDTRAEPLCYQEVWGNDGLELMHFNAHD